MKQPSEFYTRFCTPKKKFAPLIDPDKFTESGIREIAKLSQEAGVDFIFYGGSLLTEDNHRRFIDVLKENCSVPVILFPGSQFQLKNNADAILLLSLISGRNPEMLIGKHVEAAPYLKASQFEIIPTGYVLVESGKPTAVSYMSHTTPIPADKNDIAVCTAMAGEMLGLKLIYMDAGSGASNRISPTMITKVKASVSIPLIVGGGIRNPQQAKEISQAGADIVVVGNAIEDDPSLIIKIAEAIYR